MKPSLKDLDQENVSESLGGIISRHSAEARAAGLKKTRVRFTLKQLRQRVQERINAVAAIDPSYAHRAPMCAELRTNYLPPLLAGRPNAKITGSTVEFDLDIPPPRRAHAR